MATGRTRRKNKSTPKTGLLLGALGAFALVACAAPFVVIEVARGRLASQPCVVDASSPAAPDAAFYSAAQVLDLVAVLPAVGARARTVSNEATQRCLAAFTDECALLRDAAVDAARIAEEARLGLRAEGSGVEAAHAAADWREYINNDARYATCSAWSEWMLWIDGHGVDSLDACPVCAPS